jgi:hypothetical protein
VLPMAPSTYHDHVARRTDPSRLRRKFPEWLSQVERERGVAYSASE